MRTSLRIFAIAVSLVWASPAASLAQTYWQVADGDWSTGGSWTAGEPVAGVDAFINNGGLCWVTSPGEICDDLFLGLAGGDGTVKHGAGSVTVGSTLSLGTNVSGSGTYKLSGTGQLSADYIAVGSQGTGELWISGGADASCLTGYVGRWSGSTGIATVDGVGSSWTNSASLYVGGSDILAGGTGSLTVSGGGTVTVADTLKVWGPGTVNLDGGLVVADGVDLVSGGAFTLHHQGGPQERGNPGPGRPH